MAWRRSFAAALALALAACATLSPPASIAGRRTGAAAGRFKYRARWRSCPVSTRSSCAASLAGASASLALGIPAIAPLLLIGGIVDGYAIGSAIGMVAAERSEDGPRYRSPIIVRLKR